MHIINSKTDIATYVDSIYPEYDNREFHAAMVSAIQDADHPLYGQDWADWLEANLSELRAEVEQ